MENVAELIQNIRYIPGANVDTNFGQGRSFVYQQYLTAIGEVLGSDQARINKAFDNNILEAQKDIKTLMEKALPHSLPADYLFFLEFYGGLSIVRSKQIGNEIDTGFLLELFGLGPMTHEWYDDVMFNNFPDGDIETSSNYELLFIGIAFPEMASLQNEVNYSHMSGETERYILELCLDVAGVVKKHGVIAHKNPSDKDAWKVVANSFTEFLEQVAVAGGNFTWE